MLVLCPSVVVSVCVRLPVHVTLLAEPVLV